MIEAMQTLLPPPDGAGCAVVAGLGAAGLAVGFGAAAVWARAMPAWQQRRAMATRAAHPVRVIVMKLRRVFVCKTCARKSIDCGCNATILRYRCPFPIYVSNSRALPFSLSRLRGRVGEGATQS